jgi:hypothetical protein
MKIITTPRWVTSEGQQITFDKHGEVNFVDPDDTLVAKATKFIKDAGIAAYVKVSEFVLGTWQNLEGIALLTGASIGFSYLIGELPFLIMLPAFIEGAMVAPVLAVLAVGLLLLIAKWRKHRRESQ